MFYRLTDDGNAAIFNWDGSVAIKIDANVYPVNSQLSTRYEHPAGIILTVADAEFLGIFEESITDPRD